MMSGEPSLQVSQDVLLIRQPTTIRARANELYQLGLAAKLKHFRVNSSKIKDVAELVMRITEENYPDGKIPYHSRWPHFKVGGVDRVEMLKSQTTCGVQDSLARARMHYDLVVPSILLDAGAGMTWKYKDHISGATFDKSEGLAVASFDMFADGLFSSDAKCPLQADSEGLQRLREDVLVNAFQVTPLNPLVGVSGRLDLLRNLGKALSNKEFFGGPAPGRVGALVDYLIDKNGATSIDATSVLQTVLSAFGGIWPGRIDLDGVNLGDVWRHSMARGDGRTAGLVPFHKLSQWLTYSLLEPLEWCGIRITGVEKLTGLAEYRNGGLFIDMGVLELTSSEFLEREWLPGDEFIVEWRALTVALLDVVADEIRRLRKLTPQELPLAKVLQGGTWAAGRYMAKKLRADGGSPIKIKSDGTVF
jgi:hypothetical protein